MYEKVVPLPGWKVYCEAKLFIYLSAILIHNWSQINFHIWLAIYGSGIHGV